MKGINLNHKRPYRKLSDAELHGIKNNLDLNPRENSHAEAELSYRQSFWPMLVAIATIITAIVTITSFVFRELVKPIAPPARVESNEYRKPTQPIKPEEKVIHELPPHKGK